MRHIKDVIKENEGKYTMPDTTIMHVSECDGKYEPGVQYVAVDDNENIVEEWYDHDVIEILTAWHKQHRVN